MQRLRSLRRSLSRSSRRKSSGTASSSSSRRASRDLGSPARSDISSTPDLNTHVGEPQTVDDRPPPGTRLGETIQPPAAASLPAPPTSTDEDLTQPHASPASFTSSISDPPVLVEPPSPSPPTPTVSSAAVASATSRELPADSLLRRRRLSASDNETPPATDTDVKPTRTTDSDKMPVQRPWLVLAIASGGFAALNGVFAKLPDGMLLSLWINNASIEPNDPSMVLMTSLIIASTTADLTTTIVTFLHHHLHVAPGLLNPVIRGTFFLLNLLSNAIMWALFTRALTAHSSATKVSLINTSANFLVTAVLGTLIFAEALPAGWFGGAALLVLGTLIIGRDRQGHGEDGPTTGLSDEEIVAGLGAEKDRTGRHDRQEMQPLLAGDETEGVPADGEE